MLELEDEIVVDELEDVDDDVEDDEDDELLALSMAISIAPNTLLDLPPPQSTVVSALLMSYIASCCRPLLMLVHTSANSVKPEPGVTFGPPGSAVQLAMAANTIASVSGVSSRVRLGVELVETPVLV